MAETLVTCALPLRVPHEDGARLPLQYNTFSRDVASGIHLSGQRAMRFASPRDG